jgi:hypothetical protein
MKKAQVLVPTVALIVLTFVTGMAFGSTLPPNGVFKGYPVVSIVFDGRDVQSPVPAVILGGSTLAPLRAIGEALGWTVAFDPETYTAFVDTKGNHEPTIIPPAESAWTEVASWHGTGTKITEKFVIMGQEWRVSWGFNSGSPEFSSIWVFEAQGQRLTAVANVRGTAAGVSYLHFGPGQYYLTIDTVESRWSVRVEEQRPPKPGVDTTPTSG